jgi:predicted helicase
MPEHDLLSLIENIQSWDKLERKIAELPTEIKRGNAFEEFCHAFFLLDPVFKFKTVYRHNEIPPSIRARLGYPGIQDIGIDGLGITHDEKIFAYQAKFRSDSSTTPTLRELSTFFTVSDKADWRITISNAKKLPLAVDDRVRQAEFLRIDLTRWTKTSLIVWQVI